MTYLDEIPAAVPPGMALVHNNVRPARRLSTRGFRAWLEPAGRPNREICPCTWAAELGPHYRAVRPRPRS
jgi:hypothetical protein